MTATAETQKPEVMKDPEASQEGWPGWGLSCKDQDAKEKCLLKQSPELWAPSLIRNSLSAGLQNKQHFCSGHMIQCPSSNKLSETPGTMDDDSHESRCQTCCKRNRVSPSGEMVQAPHGGGRDLLLLQPCVELRVEEIQHKPDIQGPHHHSASAHAHYP